LKKLSRFENSSYVAAAYVKWIEAAGGRAVPIRFYVSDGELRRLFDSVNGLILPGGLTDLYLDDPYVAAATKLYDWAVESNEAGSPFPIWGTCLGHQLLQIIVTRAHFGDILVETDAVVSSSFFCSRSFFPPPCFASLLSLSFLVSLSLTHSRAPHSPRKNQNRPPRNHTKSPCPPPSLSRRRERPPASGPACSTSGPCWQPSSPTLP